MKEKDHVIKHLEMIQGIVNRLGHDSFLIKGWSMTILVAGIIFISKNTYYYKELMLTFIIIIVGFWILDGYFLWQERLFRKVYDEIRKQEKTDFSMNIMKHVGKKKCTWRSSVFSVTLGIFYGVEVLFSLVIFIILKCS